MRTKNDPFAGSLSCCCDPSGRMPELVNLAMAPALPPGSCSGVNPQSPSPEICAPRVPCCTFVSLSAFLGSFSYPIGPGLIVLEIPGAVPAAFTGQPNGSTINTDADLLNYLNVQLALAVNMGYTVEGPGSQFQITDGMLKAPKVGGSCLGRLGRNQPVITNFAPTPIAPFARIPGADVAPPVSSDIPRPVVPPIPSADASPPVSSDAATRPSAPPPPVSPTRRNGPANP